MTFFWLHPHTELRPSVIHGLGRFSIRGIDKNEVICIAGGQGLKRSESVWETGLLVDEDIILQLPPGSAYEAYLNHSCDPNLYIDGQIVFRALRRIESGEELTVDYGTFMVINRVFIESCRCQASQCRGTVKGDDYKRSSLPLSWYAQKKLKAFKA